MRRALLFLFLISLPISFADTAKEEPVGLVLQAGGSKVVRADSETPLAARPGDLLFTGDGIRTATDPASFLFCPAKAIDTLGPSGEVKFEAKQPKVKTGKISEAPARACVLPQTLRVAVASQQHYGVSMTRGGDKPVIPPMARDQFPADLKAELAPLDAVLSTNASDPSALIAEASAFENRKLLSNTFEVYDKLSEIWPDAVWVKSKKFELREQIAEQAAAATAAERIRFRRVVACMLNTPPNVTQKNSSPPK